jgi:drug/metabolite transporter (DMT)-like permease
MALATAALIAVNRPQWHRLTLAQWKAGALAGVFLAAGYQLQTLGLARTTAAKSGFITGLVVVFVPALTLIPRLRPAGTKAPGWTAAAGAVLAFAGLLLLTTPSGTRAGDLVAAIGLGDWLTLGCAVCFAAHLLTLATFARSMTTGVLATLQIGFATLTMLGTLPFEHAQVSWTVRLVLALAVCSLLATAAAFTIQSFAQSVLPPTTTVVILTLEPVFAWLTSLLWLRERLDGRAAVGAVLILGAIAVIELVPSGRLTEIPA